MSLTKALDFDSMWFAKDREGHPVTRRKTCLCGRAYTQALLSERVLKIIERQGSRAVAATMRQIPDLYVPVECPSCERRVIASEARRAGEPHFITSEAAD